MRSLQTFIAAYLAGMRHPRDVFTISRRESVAPPLVEFRCDGAARLWLSMGAQAWTDEGGPYFEVQREHINKAAEQTENGSIAAVAAAAELARLRTWEDPFNATPKSGLLVGDSPAGHEERGQA